MSNLGGQMKQIIFLMIFFMTAFCFAKDAVKTNKKSRKPSSMRLALTSIKCSVDSNGEKVDVPLQETMGGDIGKKISFKGTQVGAGFYAGDQYEGQQVLSMYMNGTYSKIYSAKEGLYVLESQNGIRFQCYAQEDSSLE
jgi:hypothetical protein